MGAIALLASWLDFEMGHLHGLWDPSQLFRAVMMYRIHVHSS